MSSRFDNIQSRSIYVGSSTYTAPSLGNLIVDSNIGIGTTAPVGKLTIKSPGEVGSYGDGFVFQRNANTAKLVRMYESSADGFLEVRDGGDTIVSKLSGYTGTPSFFLSNVGIGTNSPQSKLSVAPSDNDGVGLYDPSNNLRGLLFVNNTSGVFSTGIRTANYWLDLDASGVAQNAIRMFTGTGGIGTGSERMRITASGNVGIGTSAPQKPLDAVSGANNFVTVGAATAMAVGQWSGIHFGYREDNSFYRKSAIVFERTDLTEGNAQGKVHILNGPQAGGFSATLSDSKLTIAENGNVGIGTTSPSAKLHVVGGGNIAIIGSAGSGQDNYIKFQGSSNAFDVGTTTSGYWGIADSGVAYRFVVTQAGNVGIGVTNPSYTLDVVGEGRFGTGAKAIIGSDGTYSGYSGVGFGGTTNGYNRIFGHEGTSDGLYLSAATGNGIWFWTNGSNLRMTISPSGNVGIGTTNPLQKLDIAGNISLGSWTKPGSTYVGLRRADDGSFGGGGDSGLVIESYNHASPYAGDYSQRVHLRTHLYNGGSHNILTAYGFNIGIGITSPAEKLHVAGNVSVAASTGTKIGFNTTDSFSGYSTSIAHYGISYGWNTNPIALSGYYGIGFFSDGNERMRINSSGNVGLGTTNPSQKLEVDGALKLTSNPSVTADSSAAYFWNQGGVGPTIGGLKFQVQTNGSTAAMTIDENQRVGIGTTSPSQLLTINGADGYLFTVQENGPNNSRFQIYQDNTDSALVAGYNSTSTNMTFYTGSSERMRIASDGNVGIGTTSPSEKLYVNSGGAYMDTTVSYGTNTKGIVLNQEDGTGYGTGLWFRQSGLTAGIGSTRVNSSDWATDLRFYTHPSSTTNQNVLYERMRINSEGNVGIGNSNPTSILQLGPGSYPSTNFAYNSFNAGSFGILFRDNYDSYLTFNTVYTPSGWVNKYNAKSAVINFNDGQLDISTGTGNTAGGASNLSTKLVMTNSGNVGIGTTSPSRILELSQGEPYLRFNPTSVAGAYLIGAADGKLYITPESTYVATMTFSSGNVGIGTTSPSYKLHVAGNGAFTGISVTNPDTSGTFNRSSIDVSSNQISLAFTAWGQGSVRAGTAWLQTVNNYPLVLGVNDFEVIRLATSGNVGIGTTSPGAKLDVSAGTNLNLGIQQLSLDNFSNDGIGITFSRTSSDADLMALGVADSDKLGLFSRSGIIFATGGSTTYSATSEVMRITSGGNVLVGTTTELGYKLDVNGVSLFRGSVTNTTGGFISNTNSSTDDSFWTVVSGFVGFYVNTGGYSKSTSSLITSSSGVGTMNASAILQADSNRQGFLPPRMTNSEMVAISSPAAGLVVYDTTNNKLTVYNGSGWVPLH